MMGKDGSWEWEVMRPDRQVGPLRDKGCGARVGGVEDKGVHEAGKNMVHGRWVGEEERPFKQLT